MADGKIIAISISERKGQKKHNIESANLIVDHGMEGDAHAGNWHRQISLLGIASIDHMRAQGADVKPGDFAENITVEGMVLYELAVGTHLQVGDDVILEITQIGKECHQGCEIMKQSCIDAAAHLHHRVLGRVGVPADVQIAEGRHGELRRRVAAVLQVPPGHAVQHDAAVVQRYIIELSAEIGRASCRERV